MAYTGSSNGKKIYKVEWEGDTYSSADNATLWQGYSGYPVIGVLLQLYEKKFTLGESVIHCFSENNQNELNQKHHRNYRAILLEVFERKKISDNEIKKIEDVIQQIF